jgi:hypothetical protein
MVPTFVPSEIVFIIFASASVFAGHVIVCVIPHYKQRSCLIGILYLHDVTYGATRQASSTRILVQVWKKFCRGRSQFVRGH